MGSSATLARQLAELNTVTWKAGSAEVATWARRVPDDKASIELRARHAFAVIADLTAKALAHRLPMKLDF